MKTLIVLFCGLAISSAAPQYSSNTNALSFNPMDWMNAWMNFFPQAGNANGGYQQNAYSGSNTPTNTYSSSSGNGQDFMQMWQNWPQMMQNVFPFGQAGNNNYVGVKKAETYSSGGSSNGKSMIESVNDSIAQICNMMIEAGAAFPDVGMQQTCDSINRVSQQVGNFFPQGGNTNYGGVQKAATYSSGGASNGKSSIEIVNDSIAQICNQMVQAGSAFPNVGMEQACDYINKVSQQVGSGLTGFVQF